MSYFIVFQNKTYDEEKREGILWAPKKTKAGSEIYHWSNMTKIKEGDIIFSVYKRKIVSLNTAKGKCESCNRPQSLDSVNLWEKEGWVVNVHYEALDNPVNINDNISEILRLCPSKYSPFTKTGKGNQGYLFEISNELGEYIIKLIKDIN